MNENRALKQMLAGAGILIFLTFVFAFQAKAQLLPDLQTFQQAVSKAAIPGFGMQPVFEEDEEEEEISAVFMRGSSLFMIKMEVNERGPVWMQSPTVFEGKEAEFVTTGQLSVLMIWLPETQTELSFASNSIHDAEVFKQVARNTGLPEWRRALPEITWPELIPVANRLEGLVTKLTEQNGEAYGFRTIIAVTYILNEELLSAFDQMLTKYGNEGGFLVFPNGHILNFPFEEAADVYDYHQQFGEIEFLYYIP